MTKDNENVFDRAKETLKEGTDEELLKATETWPRFRTPSEIDAERAERETAEDNDRFLRRAKDLASDHFNRLTLNEFETTHRQFYVVWFAKVLGNWKALVSTDVMDGVYYEITHNGAKAETYVDYYGKLSNEAISD